MLALLFFTTSSCKKKDFAPINPAFSAYISAFTSGIISKESTIKVRLTNDYQDSVDITKPIAVKLFDFDPAIKGKAYWVDKSTVEFRPDEPLPSGKLYEAEFYLSKLVKVPDSLETFVFQFQAIKQSFELTPGAIRTYESKGMNWYYMEGGILAADVITNNEIEQVLKAKQNSRNLKITWTHTDDRRVHSFRVDSIQRQEERGKVVLTWNGKDIGIDEKGEKVVEIPALGDFSVMNTTIVQQPEQYVSLQFSDPLQENQDLAGLIRFENNSDVRFIIEGNEIKVFPPSRLNGAQTLHVETGVKNALGYKLPKAETLQLQFEDIKPEVKLSGNGVILPNSKGLLFPFEAVNLRSVDVKIVRIFENNVGQFLQVNQLDGTQELQRVGRTIFKKNIKLQTSKAVDFGKWNTFYLDLAKLIETEPGAVYNVQLSFKKRDSFYPCGSDSTANDPEMEEIADNEDAFEADEHSYWDYYDEYYYEDYNWEERDNPCENSYYNNRKVNRNILASDLGIIAKGGTDGNMTFAVTDMITTKCVSGVELELYSFQNQLIASCKTGSDGIVTIEKLKGRPYLLIAKNGKQRGYLRLDDGSSLSLSKFDVAGEVVQKGLKGFIYGERGVWRPGDTLFLTFMLEDENKILPANHPVAFELTNPQGQLITRMVKTSTLNNFFDFTTVTDANAPTGNYTATVKVGGTSFTKTLKIETIKPNRLKINLDFGKERLATGSNVQGDLAVSWLSGAAAHNLAARVMVTLTSTPTSFPKYKDYTFDDPTKKFDSEEQTLFDGKIDGNGKAKISSEINVEGSSPGMLQANFVARVFEEGGDFSIDRFTIPYSPYTSYTGIQLPKGDKARGMILTDTNHTVQVVTIDPEGKPVSHKGLEAKVYKVQWRWWWDSEEEDLSNYVGSEHNNLVASATLNTGADGRGAFKFRVNYPDWGRYMVQVCDPVSGHCTAQYVYIDWPGWAGRGERENPGGASMLSFSSDKAKYNVKETATITFPSSGQGRALVSIESGSKVLKAYWVDAAKDQTTFKLPITPEMAPNVYVHITLIQPHAQTANDLPLRMYGVIPLMVEDPSTRLQPVITMSEVLRPEEKVTIKVKEAQGRKMTYTVAVVDEGLLDLTRFKTPDPWSSFYAREALGVKSWDMYDYVMGAFAGKMEQILSIGGDGIAAGAKNKAKRFKPVVQFFGPFELKAGETKAITFTMPNYIGSVKTMVVAGDIEKGAYGNAEKATPVRKPLMVLATLPRVVGPGEKVKLPVTLFAMEKHVKNVQVEIISNNLLRVNGEKKKVVTFKEIGDQVVNFDIDVAKGIGVGTVKIVATSGNERSEYSIELDVRNPNPPVTKVIDVVIDPGKVWESSYTAVGMAGTNSGVLEVSNMPPIDFGRRLKYLIEYPHGCIEQTTSGAFPQLYLADVVQLDDRSKKRASDNVKAGLNRIRTFQKADGGFAYWPTELNSDEWGSNYAGHFMLEAEIKGYTLPSGLKDNWKKFQTKMAKNWSPTGDRNYHDRDDMIQAYRLYTLALAKAPEKGAMNRLKEMKTLTQQSRFRLAAAYALAGQPEVAAQLVKGQSTDVKPYNEMDFTYGSDLRDEAMILETMVIMKNRTQGMNLMLEISKRMQSQEWLSTQTTAYCLIALSKYTGGSGHKQLKYLATINSKPTQITSQQPVSQVPLSIKGTGGGTVKVQNQSEGILYARITLTGTPETGDPTSAENGLGMSIVYKDLKGNTIDVSRMQQGTDFMAEVTLTNPTAITNYQNMALSQIFPSGWEIHNDRLDGGSAHTEDVPTYQDIRDDRVYTYFDLPKKSSKTFVVVLNATYLGDFYLPTVYCEAMYEHKINASRAGRWVKVVSGENTLGMK
jgi:uncharacterized protein YfaS (alpha-2-macroglobulin family)